ASHIKLDEIQVLFLISVLESGSIYGKTYPDYDAFRYSFILPSVWVTNIYTFHPVRVRFSFMETHMKLRSRRRSPHDNPSTGSGQGSGFAAGDDGCWGRSDRTQSAYCPHTDPPPLTQKLKCTPTILDF
ncbi:MAG: hypothetical protein MUO76_24250, partial [Anaerolineaceae bacterium]|nr:hypothetical protein [Anaerolineaceae bacterium]